MKLVAAGTNLDALQAAANKVQGSGTIVIDIDTKVEIPFAPDIPIGWIIKSHLAAFQWTIKRIPGVHLDKDITWTDNGERGRLTIEARSNPLPILGPIVLAMLPWLIGIGIVVALAIIGWKVFDAGKEAVKSVAGDAGIALMLVGIVVVFMLVAGKGKIPGVG